MDISKLTIEDKAQISGEYFLNYSFNVIQAEVAHPL